MPRSGTFEHRRDRGRGADARGVGTVRRVGVVDASAGRRGRASCRAWRARSAAPWRPSGRWTRPIGCVSVTFSAAPRATTCALPTARSFGVKASLSQPDAWNGLEVSCVAPSVEVSVLPIVEPRAARRVEDEAAAVDADRGRCAGAAGCPGRSSAAGRSRSSGARRRGRRGSRARTTTVPRSYGPAIARIATDRPNGAPL